MLGCSWGDRFLPHTPPTSASPGGTFRILFTLPTYAAPRERGRQVATSYTTFILPWMNRSPPYTLSTFTAHREIGHHLLHFIHIIIFYPGGTGRHLIHFIHIHTTFGGQVAT